MTADPTLTWLLVLTFPNGGSTALAHLLLTAHGTVALHPRAEGQLLLPDLSGPGVPRWDPQLAFDHAQLRSVWTDAALRAWRQRCADVTDVLVVEKSPPSMRRHAAIRAALSDMPTQLAVLTREPYATCARWYANGNNDPGSEPESAVLERLGTRWVVRGRLLLDAIPQAVAHITYEALTADPRTALAPLVQRFPVLEGIDYEAKLTVKQYPPQSLRDFNAEVHAQLTREQRAAITRGLSANPAVVEALGYRILED